MSKQPSSEIYTILSVSLAIGILISIGVYVLTYKTPAYFTSIFYVTSQDLPLTIEPSGEYNFTVAIASFENSILTRSYETTLELFNMYDLSEGAYDCLREYVDKIYLSWIALSDKHNESIVPFMTVSDSASAAQRLNSSQYRLMLSFESYAGEGSFGLQFYDQNLTKYTLNFSDLTNMSVFTYTKDGDTINRKTALPQDSKGYDLLLEANKSGIYVWANKKLIFHEIVSNYTGGNFRFLSQGAYYRIKRARIISDDLRVYSIDDAALKKALKIILDRKVDTVPMRVRRADESYRFNISLQYLDRLKRLANQSFQGGSSEYLGIETKRYKAGSTLYEEIYKWANVSYVPNSFPSYIIETENEFGDKLINFTSYTLSFTYRLQFGNKQFMLLFEDLKNVTKYGIMISEEKQRIFFLQFKKDSVEILMRKIEHPPGLHDLRAVFDRYRLHIFIDEVEVLTIDGVTSDFSDLRIETGNSYITVDDFKIDDNAMDCDDKTVTSRCRKIYPIRGQANLDSNEYVRLQKVSRTPPNKSIKTPLLPFFRKDREGSDKILSDTFYDLNGPRSLIRNLRNYSIYLDYISLEGDRQIHLGFLSMDDDPLIRITLNEEEGMITLLAKDQNQTRKVNLTKGDWHRIELRYQDNYATLTLDYKEIIGTLYNVNLSQGHYYIATTSTYADFHGPTIQDYETGALKRFDLNEDPCELRPISTRILRKGNVTLSPGEIKTIPHTFSPGMDFDFAKVTTTLIKQNTTIHFWSRRAT